MNTRDFIIQRLVQIMVDLDIELCEAQTALDRSTLHTWAFESDFPCQKPILSEKDLLERTSLAKKVHNLSHYKHFFGRIIYRAETELPPSDWWNRLN